MSELELVIHIDGASRGNPGPAGVGVTISGLQGETLAEEGAYIGETTNNVAEYRALLKALERAKAMGAQRVRVMTDSELVYRQMRGMYRVRNVKLIPLFQQATALAKGFLAFELRHIPREKNRRADELANQAIDPRRRRGRSSAEVDQGRDSEGRLDRQRCLGRG